VTFNGLAQDGVMRASVGRIASGCSSHRRVLPWMSVNRKVKVRSDACRFADVASVEMLTAGCPFAGMGCRAGWCVLRLFAFQIDERQKSFLRPEM
jgi:hypothetical protein